MWRKALTTWSGLLACISGCGIMAGGCVGIVVSRPHPTVRLTSAQVTVLPGDDGSHNSVEITVRTSQPAPSGVMEVNLHKPDCNQPQQTYRLLDNGKNGDNRKNDGVWYCEIDADQLEGKYNGAYILLRFRKRMHQRSYRSEHIELNSFEVKH